MDQNAPRPVTAGLGRSRVDVLAALEDGTDTQDDEAMLARATALGRLLFTRDRDFLAITHHWLDAGRDFAGLAYTPHTVRDFGRMMSDLELIAKAHEPPEVRNQDFHIPL